MKRFIAPLLVSTCLASPAWADTSSRAWLGNFSYTLTDLAPDDGIAPALTFTSDPGYRSGLWGQFRVEPDGQAPFGQVFAPPPAALFTPNALDHAGDGWSVTARIESGGTFESTTMEISALAKTALARMTTAEAGANLLRNPVSDYDASAFTLTPHTRVVFSASYELSAKRSYGALVPGSFHNDEAQAAVWIEVYDQSDEPFRFGPQFNVDGESVRDGWDTFSNGLGFQASGVLTGHLENTGDTSMKGGLLIGSSLRDASFPAIPEPAALASMVAGLFVVGVSLRVRKART